MKTGEILVCTRDFRGIPNLYFKGKYKYLDKIQILDKILYLVEDLKTNVQIYGDKCQFITLREYRIWKLKQI